jgi:hypothetical protein
MIVVIMPTGASRQIQRLTRARRKRLLHCLRLLLVRPASTAFAAARDHFNPTNGIALRLKRMIKSGHKPYPLVRRSDSPLSSSL